MSSWDDTRHRAANNGHFHNQRDPLDDEVVPPALQAIHQRLESDGAAWRATLPDTARLERHVHQLAASPSARPAAGYTLTSTEVPATDADDPWEDDAPTMSVQRIAQRDRRARGLGPQWRGHRLPDMRGPLAVAAVVLLVVGFVRVFSMRAGQGSDSASGTLQFHPVTLPKDVAITSRGESVAPAPSNGNIVYACQSSAPPAGVSSAGQSGKTDPALYMSTDAGAHWQTLAAGPSIAAGNDCALQVDQTDPRTVLMTIGKTDNTGGFAAGGAVTYISVHGGPLQEITNPAASQLFMLTTAGDMTYALVPGAGGSYQIVGSADEFKTWQALALSDPQLAPEAPNCTATQSITATPDGTLYALAVCPAVGMTTGFTLWHLAPGGQWVERTGSPVFVGRLLLDPAEPGLVCVTFARPAGAGGWRSASTSGANTGLDDALSCTMDGGTTWTTKSSPALPIPAGAQQAVLGGIVGIAPDSELVAGIYAGNSSELNTMYRLPTNGSDWQVLAKFDAQTQVRFYPTADGGGIFWRFPVAQEGQMLAADGDVAIATLPDNTPVAATPTTPPAATDPASTPTGALTADSNLTHLDGIPVIVPSDANSVYAVRQGTLDHSSNGGKTWTHTASPPQIPAGDSIQWVDMFASPLSAQTIFATANVVDSAGNYIKSGCPQTPPSSGPGGSLRRAVGASGPASVVSGSIPCQLQYVSTDNGQHWTLLTLPGHFILNTAFEPLPYGPFSNLPATVGSKLYQLAGLGPLGVMPGNHVMVSSDGGLTWFYADSNLPVAQGRVCQLVGVSGTLYATLGNPGCGQDYPLATFSMWKSNNGGTNWSRATLPSGRDPMALLASDSPPTLYVIAQRPTGASKGNTLVLPTTADVFASSDGGNSWKAAPAQGASGTSILLPVGASVVVLRDGRLAVLLLQTDPGSPVPTGVPVKVKGIELAVWSPGASAWQVLTTKSPVNVAGLVDVPPAGMADRLWLTAADWVGNVVTYSVYTYSPAQG